MKFAVICGPMAAAVLLLAATPALALNPQPEPPGKQAHDLNMSIQHTTAATTMTANQACGTGQTAASGTGNATGAPAGSTARNNSAGGGINTGLMTNIDKCHTPGDANDNTHTAPAPGPITH